MSDDCKNLMRETTTKDLRLPPLGDVPGGIDKHMHMLTEAAMSFAAGVQLYLQVTNPAKRTKEYLAKVCTIIGDVDIADIKKMDILRVANTLYPNGANATKNRNVITPISAVIHFLADNELRPYMKIKRLSEPQPEMRRPSANVQEILLANTTGNKHLLISFLFYQGWRIGETLGLETKNINMLNRYFTLYIPKIQRWKTIPMHSNIYEQLIGGYNKDEQYLFPWRYREAVYYWLRPICKKHGIKFTPHMARHEFGSRLNEEARATSRDLVDLGSWTNEASTRRYVSPSAAHIRSLLDKLGAKDEGA